MRYLICAAAFWLAILTVLASDAGVAIIGFFVFAFGGIGLGAWWLALRMRAFGRRQGGSDVRSPAWQYWAVVPAMLIAGIVINVFAGVHNPLFVARFRLSEVELTRDATRLLQTPDSVPKGRRRVGLFFVRHTAVIDGQVRFITTACGVVDSCGLVYAPTSEPKRWQEDTFSALRGRWWHLHEGF